MAGGLRQIDALLFDLDGTLTDPKEGITKCIAYALAGLGLDAPACDDLCWCIGPPLAGSFGKLLGSDDEASIAEALRLYRERFSYVGLYENSVYESIPETLDHLRRSGFRLFVATSKPTVYAERIIEHFGLSPYFDVVYGSKLDGRLTDKGQLIAHILQAEGLEPSRCLMIGDREHDVIGAARCSVAAIGVLYGYGTRDELTAAGAAVLCEAPSDLPQAVSNI